MKPIVAISMGDPNGIGPEVSLKYLNNSSLKNSIPVWIGSIKVFNIYAEHLQFSHPHQTFTGRINAKPGSVYVLDPFKDEKFDFKPGKISGEAGEMSMRSVQKGVDLCMKDDADALVTAPISKEAIHKAGFTTPGHTEYLAQKTGTDEVVMVLASDNLVVALATIHIPLKGVAVSLRKEKIESYLEILNRSLKLDFGLFEPKIGVLGLNPHAGDGGVIGREEIELIGPAIKELSDKGMNVAGPFAADGYFGSQIFKQFDATFAMYHDQGLIPFKTLSFGKGVNFTAGLPIIRTSPDHGTAFNIAGKNIADEKSFRSAYEMAVKMAKNRIQRQS